jgi:hypothetical protein
MREYQRDFAVSNLDRAKERLQMLLADLEQSGSPSPPYPEQPVATVTRESLKEVLDLITKARDHIMEI